MNVYIILTLTDKSTNTLNIKKIISLKLIIFIMLIWKINFSTRTDDACEPAEAKKGENYKIEK